MRYQNGQPRSIFWPLLLIGVGVLWMLSNFGIISPINIILLLRLWPLLLISLGLNILIGKDRPGISNLVSVVLVVAALVYAAFAPAVGIQPQGIETVTENFSEGVGNAESAIIHLDIDRGELKIDSLNSSDNLIQIRSTHNQESSFTASGSSTRTVEFRLDSLNNFPGFFFSGNFFNTETNQTDVNLSSRLPIDLNVDLGSGSADLDLSDLEIIELNAGTGSGKLTVRLPAGDYASDLGAGSGTITVTTARDSSIDLEAGVGSGRIIVNISEGSRGELDLISGSGSITINFPVSIGVKLTGTTGSGSVRVPSGFIRTSGSDSPGSSKSGTWESPNFDQAEYQITIVFGVGSGNIVINQE